MSRELGYPHQYLAALANGEIQKPSFVRIVEIGAYLKVTLDQVEKAS